MGKIWISYLNIVLPLAQWWNKILCTHTHIHKHTHTDSLPSTKLNIRQNWFVLPTSFSPHFYWNLIYLCDIAGVQKEDCWRLGFQFHQEASLFKCQPFPESQLGTTCISRREGDLSSLTGLEWVFSASSASCFPHSPGDATFSLLPSKN